MLYSLLYSPYPNTRLPYVITLKSLLVRPTITYYYLYISTIAKLPVIKAIPSSSTQDLQGLYNNLGLAELEALVTTGHGLSTTKL